MCAFVFVCVCIYYFCDFDLIVFCSCNIFTCLRLQSSSPLRSVSVVCCCFEYTFTHYTHTHTHTHHYIHFMFHSIFFNENNNNNLSFGDCVALLACSYFTLNKSWSRNAVMKAKTSSSTHSHPTASATAAVAAAAAATLHQNALKKHKKTTTNDSHIQPQPQPQHQPQQQQQQLSNNNNNNNNNNKRKSMCFKSVEFVVSDPETDLEPKKRKKKTQSTTSTTTTTTPTAFTPTTSNNNNNNSKTPVASSKTPLAIVPNADTPQHAQKSTLTATTIAAAAATASASNKPSHNDSKTAATTTTTTASATLAKKSSRMTTTPAASAAVTNSSNNSTTGATVKSRMKSLSSVATQLSSFVVVDCYDQWLRCSLCERAFDLTLRLPKVITCETNVCAECLADSAAAENIELMCSVCRCMHSTALKAGNFPTNSLAVNMIKMRLQQQQQQQQQQQHKHSYSSISGDQANDVSTSDEQRRAHHVSELEARWRTLASKWDAGKSNCVKQMNEYKANQMSVFDSLVERLEKLRRLYVEEHAAASARTIDYLSDNATTADEALKSAFDELRREATTQRNGSGSGSGSGRFKTLVAQCEKRLAEFRSTLDDVEPNAISMFESLMAARCVHEANLLEQMSTHARDPNVSGNESAASSTTSSSTTSTGNTIQPHNNTYHI